MKFFIKISQTFAVNGLLIIGMANLSQAYLEPGKRSFFLKILISGLVGIALAFRGVARLLFSQESPGKEEKEPAESQK